MKLVKQPAEIFVLKLLCDCGKGELVHKSSSEKGHLHKCTNEECAKEIEINKIFPTSSVEAIPVQVEDVVLNSPEEKKEE